MVQTMASASGSNLFPVFSPGIKQISGYKALLAPRPSHIDSCFKGFLIILIACFIGGFIPKELVGKITHYFDKIGVGVVELSAPLKVGDKISIEGHDKVVEQTIDSMQIDQQPVPKAKKGEAIGLKVAEPVKNNDKVFKVTD